MSKKKITLDDINDALYGKGGHADRLADKIKEMGSTRSGCICLVSTQTMNSMQHWRVPWVKSGYKPKPKFETIKKYCDLLDVE